MELYKITCTILVVIIYQVQSTVSSNPALISADDLAQFAEEVTLYQQIASDSAAQLTRQKLADSSTLWAKLAQKLITHKSNEVVELTKLAQDAQVQSLHFGAISTKLNSAVMSAHDVFASALHRYNILRWLSQMANKQVSNTSNALSHLQRIQSIREKWAIDERDRANRLSIYLQQTLEDLRKATQLAQDAHDASLGMMQHTVNLIY